MKNFFPITVRRLIALLLVIGLFSTVTQTANAATTPWTSYKTNTATVLYNGTGSTKKVLATVPKGTLLKSNYLSISGTYRKTVYAGKTGYIPLKSLSEYSTMTKIAKTRFLLSADVAIKMSAKSTAQTLKTFKKRDVYYTSTVIKNPYGESWHRVAIDGKLGFIPAGKGTVVPYVTLPADALVTNVSTSLRSYAGVAYGALSSVPKGASLSASGKLGDWYRVSYNGKIGYVLMAHTLAASVKQSTPVNYLLSQSTAVKSAARSSASTVKTLTSGNVYVTSSSVKDASGKVWHRVSIDSKTGYIPAGSGKIIASTSLSGKSYKTTASTLLRSYVGSSYAAVKTVPKGTLVKPTVKIGSWYRISYGGKTGYAYGSTLSPVTMSSVTIPGTRFITERPTAFMSKIDGTGRTLLTLGTGNTVYTTKRATSISGRDYILAKVNGMSGYLLLSNLKETTYSMMPKTMYQPVSTASVRSYAGPAHSVIATADGNDRLIATGRIGDWILVTLDGKKGYVASSELEAAEVLYQKESAIYLTASTVNLTSAPGSGNLVATVPVNNHVLSQQTAWTPDDKHYVKVSINGATGWIEKPFLVPAIRETLSKELLTRTEASLYAYAGTAHTKKADVEKSVRLKATAKIGNFYYVSHEGTYGYVPSSQVVTALAKMSVYEASNVPYTYDQFVATQMTRTPQTDKYRTKVLYVSKGYIKLGGAISSYGGPGYAISGVNLRLTPDETLSPSSLFSSLLKNATVKVYAEEGSFYKITATWMHALKGDVYAAADPVRVDKTSKEYFQFLDLSKSVGVPASTLNKLLVGKGIFEKCTYGACGQAFIDGGKLYGVNEAYLISHALLETGNGTSTLANGVIYNGRKVYNMFGIGAVDSDPLGGGSKRAYEEGWFTPEAAIIGGAKFIGEGYIHNSYPQNTLYKMRWNPVAPGVHQYATDIGWASKQTTRIYDMYQSLGTYTAIFDVPVFVK
ncbi:SH3 domain-containing protein [Exiguobacterium flavidum]|uniref:SH3 domain-containing protein n=1 Tax=Exiguobacterium flavidum TaxID=2184695 RepID=UPI000DF82B01|nr:SH3 domain-containing protein [Exiguobacterium flavidum]